MGIIENWKPIEGFPEHEVSDLGRVRSSTRGRHTGRCLKFDYDEDGYARVCLFRRNACPQKVRIYVHRLVALAFIPNPKGLPQVNHKEYAMPKNNAASNLEWRSDLGNKRHAVKSGINGAKGATFNKSRGTYHAYYSLNGKQVYVGTTYLTEPEAIAARKSAIEELPNVE